MFQSGLGECLVRHEMELTGLVTVGLLDTSGRRSGLAGGLGSELLTGSLATSGLTYSRQLAKCFFFLLNA